MWTISEPQTLPSGTTSEHTQAPLKGSLLRFVRARKAAHTQCSKEQAHTHRMNALSTLLSPPTRSGLWGLVSSELCPLLLQRAWET